MGDSENAEYQRGWNDALLRIADAIPHLKLTSNQREHAKAVIRACIEFALMTKAGFVLGSETPSPRQGGERNGKR